MNKGKISQVIGPVVDVEFEKELPNIYSALEVKLEGDKKLVLEAHQHLGIKQGPGGGDGLNGRTPAPNGSRGHRRTDQRSGRTGNTRKDV